QNHGKFLALTEFCKRLRIKRFTRCLPPRPPTLKASGGAYAARAEPRAAAGAEPGRVAPAFGAPPNTRPEIPAQVTENMESAPGNARTLEAVGGGYAARAEPRASLRAEPVGDAPALGAPPNDRPEIPLQTIENMESAPGNGCRRPGPAGAALPASHFPAKRSTSKNFCTLPVGVRGRGSFWNRMVRGILK